MDVSIDLYAVEGLSELLDQLVVKVHNNPYRSDKRMYEPAGMLDEILRIISKKQDWLRYKIMEHEGPVPATGYCIICRRPLGEGWSKQAPRLCTRHFEEWPQCPQCGIKSQGWNQFQWSPKKTRISCARCGERWSGRVMEGILLTQWKSDVLGYF
jgi:hypothetical protein